MERHSRVHLDHPSIRGRFRNPEVRRARSQSQKDLDIRVNRPAPVTNPASIPNPQLQTGQKTPSTNTVNHAAISSSTKKQQNVLKIRTVPMPAKPVDTAHLPRQARSGVLRRQMVKSSSKKFRPQKHRSFKPYLIAASATFAFVIVATGGLLVFNKVRNAKATTAVLAKQTVARKAALDEGTSGDMVPSEGNPPQDISGYTVANNMPRFLVIDKLGVDARVRRVGSDNDSAVKGPSNIYDVGWYENSSLPGETGTVLIDGHVAGQANRGVFYGLNTLKKGDKIVVERGDGKRITYSVTSIEQADFDNLDMHKVLNSAVSGKPGLNLMTASGRFNIRTNQYEKRVIVYAVQD